MKVFLAGTDLLKSYPEELKKCKFQLASFYNIQDWIIPYCLNAEDFLLDSGAFTFMQNNKKVVDWNEYIEKYADFINRNNIQNFFELDIDGIVGYSKVLEFRKKLERLTNKLVIPVWHKSRGIEEYKRMCDEYSYVAIGGIVSKEIKPAQYTAFPSMIAEAHRRGAKVHGLGFTSTSYFDKIKFDSVDSTTWNVGGKFGNICVFSPKSFMKRRIQQKQKRCVKQKELMIYNWNEWIKFQKYAEVNL